jgi:type VI secretion system protein VasG
MIAKISALQLGRIERRIVANHGVPFTYDDAVIELIASRCTEQESGGRMIDAILTNTLLPMISRELLTCMMEGRQVARVHVGVEDSAFVCAYD